MPEFHIDLSDSQEQWSELDSFSRGYIEAAFFTESGDPDRPCEGKSFADLAPETLKSMLEDCTGFNLLADAWLDKAYLHGDVSYDMERAGHDFWLTRNGHGAGFWDRELGETGTKLTEFAKTFGGFDLYVGDDGLIYGS